VGVVAPAPAVQGGGFGARGPEPSFLQLTILDLRAPASSHGPHVHFRGHSLGSGRAPGSLGSPQTVRGGGRGREDSG
jgi:hypothetical protein